MLKRKQRHCKSQRWWVTQGKCPPERQDRCTYELKETVIACTPPVQGSTGQKSQHRGGEVGLVTLLSQKLLQLTLPGKIISFHQQSVTERINHIPVQALFPGAVWSAWHSLGGVCRAVVACSLTIVYFFFSFHCLLLLERDREHGVDGEGLGGLQGEERL